MEVKISVVCPTYNSEKFVEETLLCVFHQTRLPDELILIDDGSDDETVQVLKNVTFHYRERVKCIIIENKHRGPGAARNEGIKVATGDWIAFLDSDDIWYPKKLAEVEKSVIRDKGINFICHSEISRSLNGKPKRLDYHQKYDPLNPRPQQLFHANLFSTSAVVCKWDLLVDGGGFDEYLMSAQDYELWLRLSPTIDVFFLNECLGEYIHRSDNISSGNLKKRFKNELKIAYKHRQLVNKSRFVFRIIRILMSFFLQLVRTVK